MAGWLAVGFAGQACKLAYQVLSGRLWNRCVCCTQLLFSRFPDLHRFATPPCAIPPLSFLEVCCHLICWRSIGDLSKDAYTHYCMASLCDTWVVTAHIHLANTISRPSEEASKNPTLFPQRAVVTLCVYIHAYQEGVRDRSEPAEPNQSEPFASGAGRIRTRKLGGRLRYELYLSSLYWEVGRWKPHRVSFGSQKPILGIPQSRVQSEGGAVDVGVALYNETAYNIM